LFPVEGIAVSAWSLEELLRMFEAALAVELAGVV
jgi:hypothetical protein